MEHVTESADRHEVRLMVIGKTGAGASASGNTLLGHNLFQSARSFSSVTLRCKGETAFVANRRLTVFDTPNFFNSSCPDIHGEVEKGLRSSSPGLHALLLVLTLDTYTKLDADVLTVYKQTFGKEALKYTIVLFTHGDEVQGASVEQLIEQHREISNLVEECGGRYHVLNNKDPSNRAQVTELLEKIDTMVSANENSCYTLEMFLYAHAFTAHFKRTVQAVLQIKPQYVCLVLIVAIGCINMQNKRSGDVMNFGHGCLTGLAAEVVGALSGKAWEVTFTNLSWAARGFNHKCAARIKFLGIPVGSAAGLIVAHYIGPQELSIRVFSGLAGGVAAIMGMSKYIYM
ncbi:GTPase IMAP family member 7 [Pygocentrus nattereri]|uniref:GTPase IMAP family member 8 n=1 Tax=Pygocentrus nattereri TaxID=42514 RepID=A0A3B4CAY6_PYGNA|nr:GTPase IMAP family member 7 [Pygocentrus nattereri]